MKQRIQRSLPFRFLECHSLNAINFTSGFLPVLGLLKYAFMCVIICLTEFCKEFA